MSLKSFDIGLELLPRKNPFSLLGCPMKPSGRWTLTQFLHSSAHCMQPVFRLRPGDLCICLTRTYAENDWDLTPLWWETTAFDTCIGWIMTAFCYSSPCLRQESSWSNVHICACWKRTAETDFPRPSYPWLKSDFIWYCQPCSVDWQLGKTS